MDKAAGLTGPLIIAVGNAPTALLRLKELIDEGRIAPVLIIGVPVGFVNVEYAKDVIMEAGVPYIVAKGRKGGSTIAAAICNDIRRRSAACNATTNCAGASCALSTARRSRSKRWISAVSRSCTGIRSTKSR